MANDNILPVENLPESLLVVKNQSTKQLLEKQQNVGLDQTNDVDQTNDLVRTNDGGQTNDLARTNDADQTNDAGQTNDLDQSSKLQQVADSRLSSDLNAKDQPVNNQPEIKQSKKLRAAASSPKCVSGGGESLLLFNREDFRVRQHVQLLRQDFTLATDASQEVHHSRSRPKSSASEPSTAGPSTHELVATESSASEPSFQELVEPKPSNQQLVAAKISTQKATASKSSAQQLGGSKVETQLHVVPDDPVRTVYSFDELVEKMLQSSCYMEVVAMHSRLGGKFTQHLNLIVQLFKNHVYLRGKLENMTSLGEVQSYFSNFLIPGSSNSKAVIRAIFDAEREGILKSSSAQQTGAKACSIENAADKATFAARQMNPTARLVGGKPLETVAQSQVPSAQQTDTFGLCGTSPNPEDNLYQFEYVEDGKRMYCGREIPPEAPPRPSRNSVWNSATGKWGW